MQAAASIDEFIAEPDGRFVADQHFLYACEGRLWTQVMWGRPSEVETARLVRAYAAELRARRHLSLFDGRRIESIDPRAFAVLVDFWRREARGIVAVVDRIALVRAEGLVGAIVAGFFHVLPQPFPTRVFTCPAAALDWLGWRDAAATAAHLDAFVAAAVAVDPVVRAVRNHFTCDLAGTTIDRAARRLGVSARVLQRRLRDAGTTFRDEHKRAQLAHADALLRDTDLEISRIALECGFASIQHFSNAVRRLTGTSPSQRRRDLRAR